MRMVGSLSKRRGAQTSTEYMLLISVVTIAVTGAAYTFVPTFGDGVNELGRDVARILGTQQIGGVGGVGGANGGAPANGSAPGDPANSGGAPGGSPGSSQPGGAGTGGLGSPTSNDSLEGRDFGTLNDRMVDNGNRTNGLPVELGGVSANRALV